MLWCLFWTLGGVDAWVLQTLLVYIRTIRTNTRYLVASLDVDSGLEKMRSHCAGRCQPGVPRVPRVPRVGLEHGAQVPGVYMLAFRWRDERLARDFCCLFSPCCLFISQGGWMDTM
ncbi:hypothetical protein LX36DRAFT_290335 [Colletotrichum falcatum]|nr:hypothetical protein LX36DRAFT_290335 [Colletotrichum falcatum]